MPSAVSYFHLTDISTCSAIPLFFSWLFFFFHSPFHPSLCLSSFAYSLRTDRRAHPLFLISCLSEAQCHDTGTFTATATLTLTLTPSHIQIRRKYPLFGKCLFFSTPGLFYLARSQHRRRYVQICVRAILCTYRQPDSTADRVALRVTNRVTQSVSARTKSSGAQKTGLF